MFCNPPCVDPSGAATSRMRFERYPEFARNMVLFRVKGCSGAETSRFACHDTCGHRRSGFDSCSNCARTVTEVSKGLSSLCVDSHCAFVPCNSVFADCRAVAASRLPG